jgi:hypothetical protein
MPLAHAGTGNNGCTGLSLFLMCRSAPDSSAKCQRSGKVCNDTASGAHQTGDNGKKTRMSRHDALTEVLGRSPAQILGTVPQTILNPGSPNVGGIGVGMTL